MKKTNHTTRSVANEGSALIIVLVTLVIMSGLALTILKNSVTTMLMANNHYRAEQALFTAESGFQEAARLIDSVSFFPGASNVTYNVGTAGVAVVEIAPKTIEAKSFEVTSYGTMFLGSSNRWEKTRGARLDEVYVPSFLEYGLYFEDYRNAFFRWGQVMDGKVFVGNDLQVAAYKDFSTGEEFAPTFDRSVEIGGDEIISRQYERYGLDAEGKKDEDYVEFNAGYTLNFTNNPELAEVEFDRTEAAALALQGAHNGADNAFFDKGRGVHFQGDTEIDFYVREEVNALENAEYVGYVAFKNELKYGDTEWHERPQEGLELIYVADGKVFVEENRNVDGQLDPLLFRDQDGGKGFITDDFSIYAEDDVHLQGNLHYYDDSIDSNDKLLFVSADDIWIDTEWSNADGVDYDWDGITIDAGLLATGANGESMSPADFATDGAGQIGVLEWNDFRKGDLGVMEFFGSYVGQTYGYSGLFSSRGTIAGFQINRTMDDRFITEPPPFAPVLNTQLKYKGWHEVMEDGRMAGIPPADG